MKIILVCDLAKILVEALQSCIILMRITGQKVLKVCQPLESVQKQEKDIFGLCCCDRDVSLLAASEEFWRCHPHTVVKSISSSVHSFQFPNKTAK